LRIETASRVVQAMTLRTTFGLPLVLFLSACGAAEPTTEDAPAPLTAAQQHQFASEVLAAKSRYRDQSERDRVITDLVRRYGGVVGEQPALTETREGVGSGESFGSLHQALLPGEDVYQLVKDYTVPFNYTYIGSISVGPQETLTVQTQGTGTTDTYLVAYEPIQGSLAVTMASNDDAPGLGLNSKITWQNRDIYNAHTVNYAVFAYASYSTGYAKVTASTASTSKVTPSARAGAYRVPAAHTSPTTVPACPLPYISTQRFRTYGNNGGGWIMNLIAENYDYGALTTSISGGPTSMITGRVPDDYPGFVMAFSPHESASGTIRVTQEDKWLCRSPN
jgi:hypothetical protein